MTKCDNCGDEPNEHRNIGAVVGCVSVYIGNDESYWFCSEECYNNHWLSEDVNQNQKRLHEIDDEH